MRPTGCALLIIAALIALALGTRKHVVPGITTLFQRNDRVLLSGQGVVASPLTPQSVAIVTASSTEDGCVRFHVAEAPQFANLIPFDDACADHEEIAAFSAGNGTTLQPGVPESEGLWTDAGGEVHTVALGPPLDVPVKVWAASDVGGTTPDDVTLMADADLELANRILEINRVGIHLVRDPEIGVARQSPTAPTVGYSCSPAATTGAYVKAGVLNIYYVDEITGYYDGFWCGFPDVPSDAKNPLAIYLYTSRVDESTLAHEVGHFMGLLHTGDGVEIFVPGLTKQNVMWNGALRDVSSATPLNALPRFTLGQSYRASFGTESALNRAPDPLRAGATRACDCEFLAGACTEDESRTLSASDGVCPRLTLDP
jgi:hypothetical protein